jgi:hypothetical protein
MLAQAEIGSSSSMRSPGECIACQVVGAVVAPPKTDRHWSLIQLLDCPLRWPFNTSGRAKCRELRSGKCEQGLVVFGLGLVLEIGQQLAMLGRCGLGVLSRSR